MDELDKTENKIIALRNAIQEGRDSGIAEYFDRDKFREFLKKRSNRTSK